ncbi:MAG TPA: cytochrome C [Persephonella sp.]|uniref:Doubled cxxch motif (Paired_cxxch_1) family n=1 Tax=Persephonella marina (strain DSM 14350 / EX-H1) TaxID=123214 RepID=C0QPQ3_PERMH|nr:MULTISPECIES: cytochrome c3 family protein [Persephonella]ACO04851.1 doubled cxxch motif (paired_cxxch_1) family [Persephonella marina EX-H1]HCB69736.1 cytochrome C [Persephonella sp.]
MRKISALLMFVFFLLASSKVFSAGPHEGLDCLGCHDPHYAKAQKIFKVKNDKYINPRTGKKTQGINALCLGCHNLTEFGGAGVRPIFLHMTHPVGIKPNPKIAKVPEQLLRDGVLQCVSCHDPHPSNPNWKYLRVDTKNGSQVGVFCMTCHPAKVDTKFYGVTQIKIFTSMNEETGPGQFSLDDPNLVIFNPTPNYIKPLGDYPNDIGPAYMTVPNEAWIYSPDPAKLPPELKSLLNK